MRRMRKAACSVVSGCGVVLMGLFGAPAVLLLAVANGIRKASDWLCRRMEE